MYIVTCHLNLMYDKIMYRTAGSCGFTEFDLLNYMMVSHSAQYWRNRPLGVRNANGNHSIVT